MRDRVHELRSLSEHEVLHVFVFDLITDSKGGEENGADGGRIQHQRLNCTHVSTLVIEMRFSPAYCEIQENTKSQTNLRSDEMHVGKYSGCTRKPVKVRTSTCVGHTFMMLLLLRCSTTFFTASTTSRAAVFLQAALDAVVPNACIRTRSKREVREDHWRMQIVRVSRAFVNPTVT